MPVPKFRTSASKRDMRRSHHGIRVPGVSLCSNCGETRSPHRVCGACGFYRGKQVMEPTSTTNAATDFTEANS